VKRTKLEVGERPEPADVVGRIRENVREECVRNLQDLLESASPEEHRLLNSVICTYTSAHNSVAGYGDMGLASSFQEEINNGYEYLRVPRASRRTSWRKRNEPAKFPPNAQFREMHKRHG
jgi:hypothetical protein